MTFITLVLILWIPLSIIIIWAMTKSKMNTSEGQKMEIEVQRNHRAKAECELEKIELEKKSMEKRIQTLVYDNSQLKMDVRRLNDNIRIFTGSAKNGADIAIDTATIYEFGEPV
jgi:septal ring factor EnvC (AmiA/AmiB activator)